MSSLGRAGDYDMEMGRSSPYNVWPKSHLTCTNDLHAKCGIHVDKCVAMAIMMFVFMMRRGGAGGGSIADNAGQQPPSADIIRGRLTPQPSSISARTLPQ